MLTLNSISLSLNDKKILRDLSLTLDQGDTLAIIGPSGCGKSSLLLSIAGIHPISSGSIDKGTHSLSLVLQNGGLFPWKSIRDNILLSLINSEVSQTDQSELIEDMTRSLGIAHLLDKFPNQLSGGEKQRVAVARSLVTRPDILLLDEPSSALDTMNKSIFQELLLAIQQRYNLTFVIVTHNIEEAVFLGKKIAIMHQGQIQQVLENPLFAHEARRKSYAFYQQTLLIQDLLDDLGGPSDEK